MADDHPLKRIRQERCFSLRKLGTAAMVDFHKLHWVENPPRLCDAELKRLAQVLGVEVSALQPDETHNRG